MFDSFGRITQETLWAPGGAPWVDMAFAFTGRWFDKDTRLQNNLNRWYDPAIGRWLSEDPIGFAAGDANLYRYVGNAPTNFLDPTGEAKLFGEQWVWPWDPNAAGFGDTARAYGRACRRGFIGTSSGAAIGGAVGIEVGAIAGAVTTGGPGVAPGAIIGGTGGAIGGGVSGLISAALGDCDEDAALGGLEGGVASGIASGVAAPLPLPNVPRPKR